MYPPKCDKCGKFMRDDMSGSSWVFVPDSIESKEHGVKNFP